jgi:multiple sugar transport system ATP-binding protein
MSRVLLKKVTKVFPGNVVAVKDVDLEVKDREFLVLVGPSGCGKSTTLRMVAGLEEITEGEIFIEDKLINDIPPKDRNIAMVFQNYALYPHMNAYRNMAFGLLLRKFPRAEIEKRVKNAASILGISELLNRKPRELSGGQRQRVAVGRAIVRQPKAFLFDEPLSNLDAKMRVQMRAEISKLHTRLRATMIYVTHDQVEAMTMGDRIAIMKDGVIYQIADPLTLYGKPANKFVAGFIGTPPMNFMDCRIVKKGTNFYLSEGNFELKVPEEMVPLLQGYVGKEVSFGVRPEDIYDKPSFPGKVEENILSSVVEVVEPMGSEIYLYLNTGKNSFVARIEAYVRAKVQEKIELVLNMEKTHVFDKETEKTIF